MAKVSLVRCHGYDTDKVFSVIERGVDLVGGIGLAMHHLGDVLERGEQHLRRVGYALNRIGAHRRADDTLADWFDHIVALHAAHRFDVIHALYIAQSAFVAVTVNV